VPRGAKLPRAENEEFIVEATKSDPHQGNAHRPHNEESLKVEVEHHARACNVVVCAANVRLKWPNVTFLIL
jgi:hypothetical protein